MRRTGLLVASQLAIAACVATTACSGPTEPPARTTNVILFNDGSRLLGDHAAAIRTIVDTTLVRVADALEIGGVTVIIKPGEGIPGYGIGGYSPNASIVEITVDPTFPDLTAVLPQRLPRIVAHELHHTKRWRGPGYGRTLLEALVSEGLADHFAIQFLGASVPPWSDAFPREQTPFLLAQATAEFDSPTYDHQRWFFIGSPLLPRWTGYTLGYRLVESYLAGHPGATAAQLVNSSANIFRPALTLQR